MITKALDRKLILLTVVLAFAALFAVWLVQGNAQAQEDAETFVEASDGGATGDNSIPPVTPAENTQAFTFFNSRAVFDGAAPGLPVEDFEEMRIAPNDIIACPRPVNGSVTNCGFAVGEIEPGLNITTIGPARAGSEFAMNGAGRSGTPSKDIVVNFASDYFRIDFTNIDATAVGIDLFSHFTSDTLSISIYGTSGLLGTTTAPANSGGLFWGVKSTDVITRIDIQSPTNTFEGVDNIAFGPTDLHSAISDAIAVLERKADVLEMKADDAATAIAANADSIGRANNGIGVLEAKADRLESKIDALAGATGSLVAVDLQVIKLKGPKGPKGDPKIVRFLLASTEAGTLVNATLVSVQASNDDTVAFSVIPAAAAAVGLGDGKMIVTVTLSGAHEKAKLFEFVVEHHGVAHVGSAVVKK